MCYATPGFNIKNVFSDIGILIIKVRWSWDRLIFISGIPILVRWYVFILSWGLFHSALWYSVSNEMCASFCCDLYAYGAAYEHYCACDTFLIWAGYVCFVILQSMHCFIAHRNELCLCFHVLSASGRHGRHRGPCRGYLGPCWTTPVTLECTRPAAPC